LSEKEINLSNAKEEKDKNKKGRELEIQNEKLQKIQKLEKALEIAKNNLNSPSPVPKKFQKSPI
jgi:LPS O-antigen subunit length determinant protein (WzzB/FepE family)